MKQIIIALTLLITGLNTPAALIINGNMTDTTIGSVNNLEGNNAGQGWLGKNESIWSLNENAGVMTLLSSSDATSETATNATKYAVAQVNAVTSTDTGEQLKIHFDWTAASTATGDALGLNYQLVGWKGMSTEPIAGERFFTGINFRSIQVRQVGSSTSQIDLLTMTDLGSGNRNTSEGLLTGIASEMVSADFTVELAEDISAYDYIGIKFYLGTDDINLATLVGGSQLDNVSIVAIPEPATFGLLGLGAIGLLVARRRLKA